MNMLWLGTPRTTCCFHPNQTPYILPRRTLSSQSVSNQVEPIIMSKSRMSQPTLSEERIWALALHGERFRDALAQQKALMLKLSKMLRNGQTLMPGFLDKFEQALASLDPSPEATEIIRLELYDYSTHAPVSRKLLHYLHSVRMAKRRIERAREHRDSNQGFAPEFLPEDITGA